MHEPFELLCGHVFWAPPFKCPHDHILDAVQNHLLFHIQISFVLWSCLRCCRRWGNRPFLQSPFSTQIALDNGLLPLKHRQDVVDVGFTVSFQLHGFTHLLGTKKARTQCRCPPQVLPDVRAAQLSPGHSSWPLLHTRPRLATPRQFLPTQPRRCSCLLTTTPEPGVKIKRTAFPTWRQGCRCCQGTAKRRRMQVSPEALFSSASNDTRSQKMHRRRPRPGCTAEPISEVEKRHF